jgi:CHASE2 domain-containing sensor protein
MKNSLQHICRYVLLGLTLTALLISAKIWIEHTSVGMRPELFAFQALQAMVSALNSKQDLPVAVLDISEIESRNGQVINLQKLREIISALAEQRPCAIAVHVALDPEDNPSTNQDNSRQNQLQDYYDFLNFCLMLKAETNIPVFLSVSKQKEVRQPEKWLRKEEYKELAVTRRIIQEDTTRMPIWLKADPEAEKLFSLSASLARAHASSHLSNSISWLIESIDGFPGKRTYIKEGIQYTDALVNYSKLETIQQNKISTTSDQSVKDARENFYHKMVLLGDATLKKGPEGYSVAGHSEEIPPVYLHACAAYTFACKPLYELKFIVRLVFDIGLSLLVFGGIAIAGYGHSTNKSFLHVEPQPARIIYIIGIAVLLAVIVSVYWLGVLWLDFLLVAIALWLHPRFEKMVLRLSKSPHRFADSEFAIGQQIIGNPNSETSFSLRLILRMPHTHKQIGNIALSEQKWSAEVIGMFLSFCNRNLPLLLQSY